MKILLTGANGYIGKRLLQQLAGLNHQVICCVRDKNRFELEHDFENLSVVEIDFLDPVDLSKMPKDIDVAYYLIHSMGSSTSDFDDKEKRSAENFNKYMAHTNITQVVYLSVIVNQAILSKHFASRKNVEDILYQGNYNLTVIRSGIVVGSGSASFEIIRDLCEKLPVMIAPKWINTKTQPIAIRDILLFLTQVLLNEKCYNRSFDVGGPDVLTYKQMLITYSKVRGLKRFIYSVPFITPKISSYWLYFITSATYSLASTLVNSMKTEAVARDNELQEILNITPISYEDAIEKAFQKIEQNIIVSSWKDALVSGRVNDLKQYIKVPRYGCMTDVKIKKIKDEKKVLNRVWSIGGDTGWFYASWLWQFRGFLDVLVGGVGLRRGRRHPTKLSPGDSLDFWRVLYASKKNKRLLLYAEMKLPGDAWLEFEVKRGFLIQTATFRPKGVWGRLYWYFSYPFHLFIFNGMIKNLTKD